MNKRKAIITASAVLIIGTTGGIATLNSSQKAKATDSPLVTEVDHQNDKLNNHEARIKNLETDTKILQTTTGAPSNSNPVDVPTVRDTNTNTATSTSVIAGQSNEATVQQATVQSYREIPLDADNSDCEYTYTDGTTYRFRWKTTNPQGSWQTDGSGNNGHWVKTTNQNGYCDSRAIGQFKS